MHSYHFNGPMPSPGAITICGSLFSVIVIQLDAEKGWPGRELGGLLEPKLSAEEGLVVPHRHRIALGQLWDRPIQAVARQHNELGRIKLLLELGSLGGDVFAVEGQLNARVARAICAR